MSTSCSWRLSRCRTLIGAKPDCVQDDAINAGQFEQPIHFQAEHPGADEPVHVMEGTGADQDEHQQKYYSGKGQPIVLENFAKSAEAEYKPGDAQAQYQ